MRAPVTVVTATIPGREILLGDTLKSVYRQTVEVEAHLVMAQSCTEGLPPPVHVATQQNQLLESVLSEWTMRLADDDQLLPHHIETYMPHLTSGRYDVIYSFDANQNRPRYNSNELSRLELYERFRITNWIDGSAVAIRTEFLKGVGGWPAENLIGNAEDWTCFLNLAEAGARFLCIPEDTWLYGCGDWVRSSSHGR